MSPRTHPGTEDRSTWKIGGMRKQVPIQIAAVIDNPFGVAGTWLRANLHCHLDRPGKARWRNTALDHYKTRGYDVVAGMDHDKIVDAGSRHDLVVIPGAEISCGGHLVALGIDDVPVASGVEDGAARMVAMIRAVKKKGGVCFLAHPFKSAYSWPQLKAFCEAGLDGVEVVNSNVRGKGADTGRSDQLWHNLLREGYRLTAFGNDDAHGPHEDVAESGWGGVAHVAWTGVLAENVSPEGVLDAIRNGRTYASEGPEIHAVLVQEEGNLVVRCSPCVACHFRSVGGAWGGATVYPEEGNPCADRFVFEFSTHGYRIRDSLVIVLQDRYGRRAWTSSVGTKISVRDVGGAA